ncbi:hypothetical protein WK13_34700 [Burkholderia ubonensis]|uniref:hypothetical protein n=1 Tax=Burkholderia ubonensis TaxID=101571 RepID=UPI00075D82D0|nr:hypothetical protein [Burkholderia ubonensis]KVR21690.1 hypothetical protein WK13_34700 [Burkholderia ubonensis]
MADIIDLSSPTGVPNGTMLKDKGSGLIVEVTKQDESGNIWYTGEHLTDEGYCRFGAIAETFDLVHAVVPPEEPPMEVQLPKDGKPTLADVTEYGRLTVQGKYTALLCKDGTIPVLRYGDPWIENIAQEVGGKFIMAVLYELFDARERIAELEAQLGTESPKTTGAQDAA